MMGMGLRMRTVMVMLTISTLSVLSASGIFLYFDQVNSETALVDKLEANAKASANEIVESLFFDNPQAAVQSLKSLDMERTFLAAAVYTPEGATFASYVPIQGETLPKMGNLDGPVFHSEFLVHQQSIDFQNKRIGTLVIKSDLSPLTDRQSQFVMIMSIALLISLMITGTITFRLESAVIEPILELSEAAENITRHRDYSIRVEKVNNDEIGVMVRCFNLMLAEIQLQESELTRYSQQLHELVEERTLDLKKVTAMEQSSSKSLAVSEKRFRALSTQAPIGIIQVDRKLKITYANPTLEHIFRNYTDVLKGSLRQDLIHPDDAMAYRGGLEKLLEHNIPFTQVLRVVLGNDVKWINLRLSPLEEGIHGFVGTVEDITDRKRIEAEKAAMVKENLRLSREAGMAEIATSVLHNVGNVLNSVNVSAQVIDERLRISNSDDIDIIAKLMQAEKSDLPRFMAEDPRGAMIPDYLATVSETIHARQQTLVAEMGRMVRHVDHIKTIVNMQQSHAKVSELLEEVTLQVLVDEAIELSTLFRVQGEIKLTIKAKDPTPIWVDKHKVLQILVNLLNNAKDAIFDGEIPHQTVLVQAFREGDRIAISVADSGIGIENNAMDTLFAFGVTTKENGHGFGLHASANAARQMGGALTAKSPGHGQGATFQLTLPIKSREIHVDQHRSGEVEMAFAV